MGAHALSTYRRYRYQVKRLSRMKKHCFRSFRLFLRLLRRQSKIGHQLPAQLAQQLCLDALSWENKASFIRFCQREAESQNDLRQGFTIADMQSNVLYRPQAIMEERE